MEKVLLLAWSPRVCSPRPDRHTHYRVNPDSEYIISISATDPMRLCAAYLVKSKIYFFQMVFPEN